MRNQLQLSGRRCIKAKGPVQLECSSQFGSIPFSGTSTELVTWLKDKSLADLDNLPAPDVMAEKIAENLESALGSFREVLMRLKE